jgi:phosphoserine aminotransferase
MTTVNRVYNFSAGPAVLPLPVLEQIQRELIAPCLAVLQFFWRFGL